MMMKLPTISEQATWDKMVVVAAGAILGGQTTARRIAQFKSGQLDPKYTVADALRLLDDMEKSKRIFAENLRAAMRTAHNLWPDRTDIGKTLQMEAQLQVDRGKLPL
jgi:hypothetical protein